jgi:signal transduction histidine kinase
MLAQEVERLIALISQTLDFVRPGEAGQQPTALNQLLQDILTLVNKQLQQNKIETRFSQDPNLPLIPLVQVFLNLILNAIDAMPYGGILSLATGYLPNEQRLMITVQDSGCGMAPEVVGRIFEPFYSTKENGTGLGLSISYSIIERHGGQIEVASKPGLGSRFTVYLTDKGNTIREDRIS